MSAGLSVCRAIAFAAPLIAYVLTAAPAVQPGDSAELSTAVATLGVPHSPGYPVYVLATHPFTWLPVGDVGYRVNLASAVYAAICVLMIFEVLLALGVRPMPALISSQFAAFSYYFWSGAVVAEVYTFDVLLLMIVLRSIIGVRQSGSTWWLAVAATAAGLGIANRSGFVLFLPLLLVAVLPGGVRATARQVALASLLFLAGLCTYLFVPMRSTDESAYVWGARYLVDGSQVRPDIASPGALWDFFTLKPFRWLFFVESRSAYSRDVWTTATWAWAAFLGGGTLLGVAGLVQAWRARRIEILLIGAMAIVYAAALAAYSAPDTDQMFLPFIVLWAIPAGVGLATLWDGSSMLRVCAALCVATLVVVNLSLADRSDATSPRDNALHVLRSMEPDAIVIGYWPEMAVMDYLQHVEGERRDVRLVQSWAAGPFLAAAMIDANRAERPVYVQVMDTSAPPEGARAFAQGWVVFDNAEASGGAR